MTKAHTSALIGQGGNCFSEENLPRPHRASRHLLGELPSPIVTPFGASRYLPPRTSWCRPSGLGNID